MITHRSTPVAIATNLLERADAIRVRTNSEIDPKRRGPLGQFMTSSGVASFMTGMFRIRHRQIRLLDPGAGTGCLTAAFVAQQLRQAVRPKSIKVTAYEIDSCMALGLMQTLRICEEACRQCRVSFAYDMRKVDYIRDYVCREQARLAGEDDQFDCVVMNPPYRKINSQSETRRLLRSVGIETSNYYPGFMLLAARQLADGGEFVSITPRSFCNGPYFQSFRREFLDRVLIDHIHVFESRTEAFREDEVLQENIILHGVRHDGYDGEVAISSTATNGKYVERTVSFGQVVRPDDREKVIHIITDDRGDEVASHMLRLSASINDLGFRVSTGRVIDFRARDYLRDTPVPGTAPLIFPTHIKRGRIDWPNGHTRKPNAIVDDRETIDLLVKSGFYVLVKRFSAKEERRRIVAGLFDPREIKAARIGFDNKTNYIHAGGGGLPEAEARGLTIFLNSSLVDEYFRLFSGHTQVNAADLRRLPYPSRYQLTLLAEACEDMADQEIVDHAIDSILGSAS